MPIKLLLTSSPINSRQRSTVIKRTHFPLSAFNASTIHKAQGGTYSEVVYHYEKSHAQDLVYVALSRVTDLNGLYIVSENGNKKFHQSRQKHSTSRYGGVAILKNNDNSLRVYSEMQAYISNLSVSQTTASESAVGNFMHLFVNLMKTENS